MFDCMIFSARESFERVDESEDDALPTNGFYDSSGDEDEDTESDGSGNNSAEDSTPDPIKGYYYDAMIFQLGSFTKYKMFHTGNFRPGDVVQCYLYRCRTNPISFVLVPIFIKTVSELPNSIANIIDWNNDSEEGTDSE